jgi:hypothetical protein
MAAMVERKTHVLDRLKQQAGRVRAVDNYSVLDAWASS